MWTMLAGVPGKLKTLADRLTATRAANLDKLDANITTRAAAATALSNAVWTDTRAGKLDKVDGIEADAQFCTEDPTSRPPIASGLQYSIGAVSTLGIQTAAPNTITAGSSHTYTGAGVVEMIALHNGSGSSVAGSITITIDGVVALTWSGNVSASSALTCAGCFAGDAFSLGRVPFRSSLQIACTGLAARYRYYKVA